jgi:hypothetical protein
MSRFVQVLVVEALVAHVWGSYVAMSVGMLGLDRGAEVSGLWVCATVMAPVTFPGWVALSLSDESVRWAGSTGWAIGSYAVAAILVVWDRNRARSRRPMRRQRRECGECGYDLRGNLSGMCPECGSPVLGQVRTGNTLD